MIVVISDSLLERDALLPWALRFWPGERAAGRRFRRGALELRAIDNRGSAFRLAWEVL